MKKLKISIMTTVFIISKGAYQLYTLKPPAISFVVGKCENPVSFDMPCCEQGKICPVLKNSLSGK